ncbi:MAG: transposase [Deltaproteobacteria bacterium]|nr:transposase [Deltaproteobacteria bacterium]
MTFSLLPQVTHAWRRRGRPKRVNTPGCNVRVSVFGAYRWPDGPFRFALDRGGVRTDLFLPVLETLRRRARRTGRFIVLVSDNGSAQTSKRSTVAVWRAFPGVVMLWLPAYSSEQLNDIENLWHHLKDDYFSEMLVTQREDFAETTRRLLTRMTRPRGLRQLLKPRRRVGKNF